ncbi:hypothetical protein Cfor_06255 [Coptotermes formosanus]|uniref:Proline dehydrogenase n=1 Tax=Coptotermes formosanus TaxID=36987 RepID=A0A6L2P9B8_COPFO|nr:hypothetical protein Cfor_06255 [Coptotermes formosanus]
MGTSGSWHILTSCWRCGSVRMYSPATTSTPSANHKTTPTALQFDDHRTAFQHKNTWELLRALLVLRACGSDFLVDNSLKVNLMIQSITYNPYQNWA